MSKYQSYYNKTTNNLSHGSQYLSFPEQVHPYTAVIVNLSSDVNLELSCEWSNDNINYEFVEKINVFAGNSLSVRLPNQSSWFRTRVTNNSGSTSSYLRLHCHFADETTSYNPLPRGS